ncbi:NADP-dependent oxidoreductase domain-containing protein [Mycena galopus ATCC 62051]|nr:NADP-dependent oxidoreductase domain-containing protein [Mycena galopus ATCC 62051]
MPWNSHKLNDGYDIPGLAFGTWKLGKGDGPTSQVAQAISVGFSHLDTAQLYRNETEVGSAIDASELAREEIFITTKYSRTDKLDIQTSIRNSLKYLGVSYVDLYLIHFPRAALPDIPTIWKEMEEIQSAGMARSIGVSNFDVNQLELLASARVKPVVNQILLHPYVYTQQLPVLEYAAKHEIVIEAYSVLIPITSLPGGPLDEPLSEIATKHSVTPDQVLLAWTKSKGAVVVTTSSKKSRLEGYLDAGDLVLTDEDIAAIEIAGAEGPPAKPQR